jgi:hypothetical protein
MVVYLPRILNGSFDYTATKSCLALYRETTAEEVLPISKILGFKSVAILLRDE